MDTKFTGSSRYVASNDLMSTVNIAMALQKPLLIKGEPGTGKTMLAQAVSEALGKKLIIWNVKSTTKAQDGLYVYDVVQRLYDSQFGNAGVDDIAKYIKLGKLGEAFTADEQVVLLKCCSQYPAQYEDMNVATIADMKERFGVPVGLSDHSMGSLADVVAVSVGAQVIEKHVCLDRTIDNPDAAFSMEIGEFAQMVQDVRNACVIKGKATYELTEHEKSSLKYRRSLVAVKPIAEGEAFTEENVRSIRPAIGIKPKYYRTLLGRKAKKAYRFGEPILPGEVE